MPKATYTQNVEIRFKAVSDHEYDVFVEDQFVGVYNIGDNYLYLQSEGAQETLAGAVVGAVRHQFKLHPEVSYES